MPESTRIKGNRAEAHILAALLEVYETVLLPYGGNCRYDLVVEMPEGFRRVQCKAGRLRNGVIKFNTSSSTMHWKNGNRRSYFGEADYFGIYCPDLGTNYLVPVSECGGTNGSLRLDAPKNRQDIKVRWAKDYLIKEPLHGFEP